MPYKDLREFIERLEREGQLGGTARQIHRTLDGRDVQEFLAQTIRRVSEHSSISLHLRPPQFSQKIAMGLNSVPVPPGRRSGAATTMNSHRPSDSQTCTSSSNWRLSAHTMPMAVI